MSRRPRVLPRRFGLTRGPDLARVPVLRAGAPQAGAFASRSRLAEVDGTRDHGGGTAARVARWPSAVGRRPAGWGLVPGCLPTTSRQLPPDSGCLPTASRLLPTGTGRWLRLSAYGLLLTAYSAVPRPAEAQSPGVEIKTKNASSVETTRVWIETDVNTAILRLMDCNVGLGTTSPSASRFHIVGGVDSFAANGLHISSTDGAATEYAYFAAHAGSNYARIGYWADGSFGNVVFDNGNVGIGSAAPGGKLHVEMAASSDAGAPKFYTTGLVNGGFSELVLGKALASNQSVLLRYQLDASTSRFSLVHYGDVIEDGLTLEKGGDVGIGTSSPASRLSVGATSQFRIDSSGDLVRVRDVAYSWPAAQGAANRVLLNDGAGTLSWAQVPAAGVAADTLDFTEFKDAMTLDATTTVAMAGFNLALTGTGNVGVGTATPAAKLDVTGGYFRAYDNGSNSPPASGKGVELIATGSIGYVQSYNRDTTSWQRLELGGSPVTVSSGNLGVGAAAPGTKLEVNITANNNTFADADAIRFWDGSNGWQIGETADANFQLWRVTPSTLSSSYLTVSAGGSIGIGSTSPAASLDIGGNPANAIRHAYLNLSANNASVTDRPYIRGSTNHIVIVPGGTSDTGTKTAYLGYPEGSGTFATRIQESLFVNTSNNVGVGTATPSSRLDIGGTSLTDQMQNLSTWGLNARAQGLIVMPEGTVSDDGAGNLTFGSTVIIMDPLAGSWVRVAAGTYALGSWGALWAPIPPTQTRGTTVTPTVTAWSDTDRLYDGRDRILLAQRQAAGSIYTRFGVTANTSTVGGSGTANYLSKWTAGTTLGNSVLYEDGSGNIGIGTTIPSGKLHIGGTNQRLYLGSSGWFVVNRGAGAAGDLYFGESSDTGKYIFRGSGALTIEGNVGLNSSIPGHKLDLVSATAQDGIIVDAGTYPEIRFEESNVVRGYVAVAGSAGGYGTGTLADSLIIRAEGALHLLANAGTLVQTIATSGNVGIGSISPAQKLAVGGIIETTLGGAYSSGAVNFRYHSLNSNSNGWLYLGDETSAVYGSRGIALGKLWVNDAAGIIMAGDATDLMDFTADSTNDNRGISFEGRTALSADFNDGYLRINNAGEFTNGTYTPGVIRADGGFSVDGATVLDGAGQWYYCATGGVTHKMGAVNTSGLGFDASNNGTYDLLVYEANVYANQVLFGYGGTASITTYDTNESLSIDPNGTGAITLTGNVNIGTSVYDSGTVMDIGSTSVNYPGNSGWAATWNANLLLSGYDSTSISFHDSGARVDTLRVAAGQFNIGENVGWGVANTRMYGTATVDGAATLSSTAAVAGVLSANGGISVDGSTVIDDGAGWHRTYGATGWYNGTYGGGWYMTDTTWIRSYNSKSIYQDTGTLRTDGVFQVGNSAASSVILGSTTANTTNPPQVMITDTTTDAAGLDGNVEFLIKRNTYTGMGLVSSTATASFIHFGDLSSANQYAIEYWNTDDTFRLGGNGILALAIPRSNGNVGIASLSPLAKFTVTDNDESTTLTNFTQAVTDAGVLIDTQYTAGAYTPGVFWSTSNNNQTKPKAGIWLLEDGSGTDLYFGTSNNYGTGVTNNGLVLDQSGNVGIGSVSPAQKLDVNGQIAVGGVGVITNGGNDVYANIRVLRSSSTLADGMFIGYGGSGGPLRFYSNSGTTELMSLTTGGNLGVGSTAPTSKLEVAGDLRLRENNLWLVTDAGSVATDSTAGINWHLTDNSYGIFRTSGAWTASTYQQLKIRFPTGIILQPGEDASSSYDKSYVEIGGGGKGLMVTYGNVGLNTTTAGRLLDINGAMRIRSSSTPGSPAVGDIYQDGTNLYFYDGTWVDLTAAGGSGAPTGATYVTLSNDATLSAERVLTGTANQITVTDGGANTTVTLSTPQNIHTGASPTFANETLTGYLSITGAQDTSGNLRFSAANPYISASSYFVAPGGAYFNSGIVYTEAAIRARGGILDDGGDLELQDTVRLNDNIIYFRSGSDTNHGIGYNGTAPDGPSIWGWDGVKFEKRNGGATTLGDWNNSRLQTNTQIEVITSGERVLLGGDTSNPSIEIKDYDGDGLNPYIDFANSSADDFDMRIVLTGNDALNFTGGNVGIGSTGPVAMLDVVAATSGTVKIGGGANGLDLDTDSGQNFRLGAGGTERLTILAASGNVGLGSSNPAANLAINGSTLQINGLTYTWPASIGANNYVLTAQTNGTLSWAAGGGGSLAVREVDGAPSVASVTTLEFDQADGFTVTDQTGGVARVVLGTVPVTAGGTGATSLTGNGALVTNSGGTALTSVTGSNGQVLKHNGTTWVAGTDATSGSGEWTKTGTVIYQTTLTDNVGIGTTATVSNEELTILTSGSTYGWIHHNGTIQVGSYLDNTRATGQLGTRSNHGLEFFTNNASTPQMTLATSGNVGIGSGTPRMALDVVGQMRSTGQTVDMDVHTTRDYTLSVLDHYVWHDADAWNDSGAPDVTLPASGTSGLYSGKVYIIRNGSNNGHNNATMYVGPGSGNSIVGGNSVASGASATFALSGTTWYRF